MPSDHPHTPPTDPSWFERNVKSILIALYVASAAVFAADLLIEKHGPFEIEHWFGFYAIYGFIACVVLVLLAKEMRRFLMRSEDYYDR